MWPKDSCINPNRELRSVNGSFYLVIDKVNAQAAVFAVYPSIIVVWGYSVA